VPLIVAIFMPAERTAVTVVAAGIVGLLLTLLQSQAISYGYSVLGSLIFEILAILSLLIL